MPHADIPVVSPGDSVVVRSTNGNTHLEVVDQVHEDGSFTTIASAKYKNDHGRIVGICRKTLGGFGNFSKYEANT